MLGLLSQVQADTWWRGHHLKMAVLGPYWQAKEPQRRCKREIVVSINIHVFPNFQFKFFKHFFLSCFGFFYYF